VITSELLEAKGAIVLLGAISGRSTGTMLVADSYCSSNTWVTIWSPRGGLCSGAMTRLPCSLASGSGRTRETPPGGPSTMVKPCSRSADSSCS